MKLRFLLQSPVVVVDVARWQRRTNFISTKIPYMLATSWKCQVAVLQCTSCRSTLALKFSSHSACKLFTILCIGLVNFPCVRHFIMIPDCSFLPISLQMVWQASFSYVTSLIPSKTSSSLFYALLVMYRLLHWNLSTTSPYLQMTPIRLYIWLGSFMSETLEESVCNIQAFFPRSN